MTEFRSIDQLAADFRRVDPRFGQVNTTSDLSRLLTDDPMTEAALYASGSGPVVYDLGVLRGPEWEGVRQFLNSRLVSSEGRRQLEQLRRDIEAADADHDGFVNNQEIVRFAQAHTDRWPNVATFRNAAEVFLNRLPAYLAQPDLSQAQIARLWGVMNHMAGELDRMGTPVANRGTVYGLSLQGFPSNDRGNPPSLIRRAMEGRLSPEELSSVHQVLRTERQTQEDGTTQFVFEGSAPLTPTDIGTLATLLDAAGRAGHAFHGMTIVASDREESVFGARNRAARECLEGVASAQRGGNASGLPQAFQRCADNLARLEGDHPERLSSTSLLARAYTGDLSPAETALLRSWMREEAGRLGLTCNGTLDCLAQGARIVFQNIARDPWHFIARNGAFIGGSWLYNRLILRNAFERRMNEACGGSVANPRQAYAEYQRYLAEQMRRSPVWRRFLDQLARNPRRLSWYGRAGINFPVTFLHLAAFNAIASRKDTGNSVVDILTDLPLIPLFHAFETYDAFRNPALGDFARANPGLCGREGAGVQAPAPETVGAAEAAPQSEGQSHQSQMMSLMPDYSQMVCTLEDGTFSPAPAPDLDPVLARALGALDASHALVSDGPAVAPGYPTLDQISVETPGMSPSGSANGRPGAPLSPLRLPNLAPILEPVPALRPAFRFR